MRRQADLREVRHQGPVEARRVLDDAAGGGAAHRRPRRRPDALGEEQAAAAGAAAGRQVPEGRRGALAREPAGLVVDREDRLLEARLEDRHHAVGGEGVRRLAGVPGPRSWRPPRRCSSSAPRCSRCSRSCGATCSACRSSGSRTRSPTSSCAGSSSTSASRSGVARTSPSRWCRRCCHAIRRRAAADRGDASSCSRCVFSFVVHGRRWCGGASPRSRTPCKYEARTESLAFPMWPFLAVLLFSLRLHGDHHAVPDLPRACRRCAGAPCSTSRAKDDATH